MSGETSLRKGWALLQGCVSPVAQQVFVHASLDTLGVNQGPSTL